MEIGIDSFAVLMPGPTGRMQTPQERMDDLMAEIELADRVGLDAFGVGEHHRAEFIDSAPTVIMAAGAARTKNIRLNSAVTVLSAVDPVRLFQQFATLDLISKGRVEIVAGRGSFVDAYPLFGLDLNDYDALFSENLDLLLRLREESHPRWQGRFRPELTGQGVFPRPAQAELPIWIGVGGTPQSFLRAGLLGLPLMVAIIGGTFRRFRPLVDLYRRAGQEAGHPPEKLKVALHAFGYVAETSERARSEAYPPWQYMMSSLAKERGWIDASRPQFDAMAAPGGAFMVGSPEEVAEKMLGASADLGGLSRITFQMSGASGNPEQMRRSIELLGTKVAPIVRQASAARSAAAAPAA
ncbi:MAG: LLM class flavin-dependent oxidoreductase [Bauldia sp.]|nr:LLM class flavin-dependent oxidoreductase [Bauldia sp.]